MAVGTALRRVDPFREFMGLQDRVNQLFRDAFSSWGWGEEGLATGAWSPAVDIYESPESLEISFELPGMDKKDIQVNLENNVLTVSGERKLEHEDRRDGYHRIERSYGSFTRSFTLPNHIDLNKVSAEYQNGLLRLMLPKRPEAQPKQIEVKVK